MDKKQKIIKDLFLSVLYSGYSPKAPGSVGSLLSVFLGLPILYYSQETLLLVSLLVAVIAIKQIDIYESISNTHDDKSIVIDELVGVWIAMAICGFSVFGVILAFVLFRLFDITKPSVIGRIDRNVKGGLGVVGDDFVAGILAGICGLLIIFCVDKAMF